MDWPRVISLAVALAVYLVLWIEQGRWLAEKRRQRAADRQGVA